jgi:DNA-binding MarR family transcriptional regulator
MAKKQSALRLAPGHDVPVKHQLVQLFWMLSPAFTRWAETHMHQKGLTPQRVRLMALLMENGPMMMSALRDELGVTSTNITALVDALEKDKMVTRRPHKKDRRATMIALTAKAEKKMTENCSEFKERVSEIFSVFSAGEQRQFLIYLERMKGALVTRNILKESDRCGVKK